MADRTMPTLGGKDAAGRPFFDTYHVAAAERLESLTIRAQMTPRLTMSYSAAGSAGTARNMTGDLADGAADARARLNAIAVLLPADCWNVALDVCCFGKGLQDIETERRWPRRSAKLVLRIALDQLARHFGLAPHQAGREGQQMTGWTSGRLPLISETRP